MATVACAIVPPPSHDSPPTEPSRSIHLLDLERIILPVIFSGWIAMDHESSFDPEGNKIAYNAMEVDDNSADLRALTTNIPLRLLREGKEQIIKVDRMTMLSKFLAAVGATSPPRVTEKDCGVAGVQFSIRIEFPGDGENQFTDIEGHPYMVKPIALKSTVMLALKHLEHVCHLRLLDYSSRIAMSFSANNTHGYITEGIGLVQEVLHKFETSLDLYKAFAMELEGKKASETLKENICSLGQVYDNLSVFVGNVANNFSEKASNARSKISDLEIQMITHHKENRQNSGQFEGKGYVNNVFFTSKDLLDYVLDYFGFGRATYSNTPPANGMSHNGVCKGVAKFKVPYIKHLKFCGNLKIKGRGSDSVNAEENAAFEALKLIEENFKVKIIDLNHGTRMEAKTEQKILVSKLERITAVGKDLRKNFEMMVNALEAESKKYSSCAGVSYGGGLNAQHIAARQFCAEGIVRVEQECAKLFDACWDNFDHLHRITSELQRIKMSLDAK